jgi:hypothetical protein
MLIRKIVTDKEKEFVESTKAELMDRITGKYTSDDSSEPVEEMNTEELIRFYKNSSKKVSAADYTLRISPRYMKITGQEILRSQWDYTKIDKFFVKEAYLSRTVERYTEMMLRNGFEFISDNDQFLGLINKTFNRMAKESNRDLDTIIGEMATRLKKYGIFFAAINREGIKHKDSNYQVLSNIRFIHPGKVTVKLELGKVKGYMVPDFHRYFTRANKTGEIPPKDMLLCTMYDNSEDFFPIPPCIGSFNDTLTLRSIEETIELLCFQFGSPLLHAKVGTPEREGTDAEVANIHNQIVRMAANGFITTTSRVKIDIVNIQKGLANLTPALEYFKKRLLAGIGISPVSLGEGDTSNRSTADSIESSLSDHCARIANIICSVFNHIIIPDILTSYGIDESKLFDEKGLPICYMDFNEMRAQDQTMYENHIMNLWNNNAITYDEYRDLLNKPKLSSADQKNIKINMFGESTPNSSNALVKSITNPSNQHGQKNAPGSVKN